MLRSIAIAVLALISLHSPASHAGWVESMSDWFGENMIDAEDDKVDISDYLSGARGFFPVPIIITEPAVGFGVGFAAGTDNGTSLFGAAHSGIWKNDHIRYLGAIAQADVKLRFYLTVGSAW